MVQVGGASRAAGLRELVLVLVAATAITTVMTWPLARHPATLGRAHLSDGRFSIWNVAWVARTLIVDPLHVYDANIFYPHRGTLAYSETNLGAGALAIPAYWLTRNPQFAHNAVMFLAFVMAAIGMYYLVRYLVLDRRAAAVSAVCFAFSPHLFAHTAHIQLLMTAGLPFSMLALYRAVDRPSAGRGATLGAVMAAQAISCGYYGVFVVLTIGFAVVVLATSRQLWRDARFWTALGVGAAVAVWMVLPVVETYISLRQTTGFGRELAEAADYSADWRAYLASPAIAHAWLLPLIGRWKEVVFPGFVATTFGVAGAIVAIRARRTEPAILYGGLALLAAWASFGPSAGLYALMYRIVPGLTLLRAPARFGLLVAFALSVLAGVAVADLLARVRRATALGVALALVTAGELFTHLDLVATGPASPVYATLAALAPGPVVELPFFDRPSAYGLHTIYMLASTTHWMPLVNGYSDYVPPEFPAEAVAIASFPSKRSFNVLRDHQARYAVVHLNGYDAASRRDLQARLDEFARYLRPIHADADARLYEIVGFP